jgi:aminopeptidase N
LGFVCFTWAIGDQAFKKAVRKYLDKYSFQSVKTQDFFDEVIMYSDWVKLAWVWYLIYYSQWVIK